MKRRTVLLSMVILGALAALIGGFASAYFSGTATTSPASVPQFTSGTIAIDATDASSQQITWSIEDLKPGAAGTTEVFTVENVGSNPFNWSVMYDKSDTLWTCDDDTGVGDEGFEELHIAMDITSDNGSEGDVGGAHNNDLGDGVGHPGRDYGQGIGTNAAGVENYILPSETEDIVFEYYLPPSTRDDCQGLTGNVVITFLAFQHENLDVSLDGDPEWRDNVDFSPTGAEGTAGGAQDRAMSNYVHLENKNINYDVIVPDADATGGRVIDSNDFTEGHVKYLDVGDDIVGIVQAYGLDPEKEYQLVLASKDATDGPAIGSACANIAAVIPGFTPAWECNGPMGGEWFWVIDYDAAPNAAGEINQAFRVRDALPPGDYGSLSRAPWSDGLFFRVREATQVGFWPNILMEDGWENTQPDALKVKVTGAAGAPGALPHDHGF